MANDLNAKVSVSTGSSVADIQKLSQEVGKLVSSLQASLDPALKGLDTGLAKNSKSINAVLTSYTKAASLAKVWADASLKAAAAETAQGNAAATLNQALEATGKALQNVKGVSEASFAAKSRTIALDREIAQNAKLAADAMLVQAQAAKTLAQATAVKAQAKVTTNGAPLSAYQAALLAARAQATADNAAAAAAAKLAAANAQATASMKAQQAATTAQIRGLVGAANAATQAAAAAQANAAAQASAMRTANAAVTAQAQSGRLGLTNAQLQAAINTRLASSAAAAASAGKQQANNQALIAAGAQRASSQIAAFNKANDEQTTSLHGSYFAMYQVAAAYGLLAAAAAKAVTAPISVAASYQNAFAQVQRVVGDGTESLDNMSLPLQVIRDQLVALSSQVPISFESLAGIATLAGQLGIATSDVTQFTTTVAQFAALTNVSAEQATLLFGQIDNLLGISGDKYANLASAVAELGAKSAATEGQILDVTAAISASSHQAGFTTEDVLGLSTALASLKISPDLAKGASTRIFAQISRDVSAGGKALEPYADLLGKTTAQVETLGKTNPAAFFNSLINAMSGVTAAGGNLTNVLDDLGIKNTRDVQVVQRLAGNYSLLADSNIQAYSAFRNSNYLATSSALIFGTLSNQLIETKNQFSGFLDQVGSAALKPLQGFLFLIDNVIHGLSQLPSYITAPIVTLAALTAAFAAFKATTAVALAGTLAFKNVLGTAGVGAGVNLRTLKAAVTDTFLGGGAAAREGAAAVATAEFEMTAEAKVATAEFARQSSVMGVLSDVMIGSAGAQERWTAASAYASVATTQQSTALRALTLSTAAHGEAATADAFVTAARTAAVELEAAAVAAGAGTQTAALNLSAASFYRDIALKVEDAGATAALAVANEATAASFKLLGLSAGAWMAIFAAVAVVGVAVYSALTSTSSAAKEAAAAQAEYKKTLFDTVGGQDAFLDAVKKDTAAFDAAGQKATAANGVYEVYGRTITDLGDKTAKVNDVFQNVNPGEGFDKATAAAQKTDAAVGNTSTTVGNFSSAAEQSKAAAATAAGGQTALATAAGITADEMERSTTAIGNNAKALITKAVADKLFGANGSGKDALLSPEDQAGLGLQAAQIQKIILAAVSGKPGDVDRALQPTIDAVKKKLADAKQELALNQTGFSVNKALGLAPVTQATIDGLQALVTKGEAAQNALNGTSGATKDAIAQANAYASALGPLADEQDDGTDSTAAQTAALIESANEFRSYTGQLSAAKDAQDALTAATAASAQAFSDSVDGAFGLSDAVTAVTKSTDDLGTALATNGDDFSALTENGQANLAALQQNLSDFAALQAEQVKAGTESAAQGAANTAEFVHNLVNELASEGVDTSQLDFLVNYVDKLVGTPATWVINADTSTALQNVQNLADFYAQVQAEIGQLDKAGARNTSDLEQNFPSFVPAPQAPGVAFAQQKSIDLDLGAARAKAAKEIATKADTAAAKQGAAADKQAGQAAKDAGEDQKNAADDAAQALAKQVQYIKDVGDYYAKLGSDSLAGATDQGKTIDALTKLGEALTTNGKTFSTYSDAGRTNLAALGSALDAYGSELSDKLQNGTITVDQAATSYKEFAGGVRSDLLSLGVPLNQINAYFNQIGATGSFKSANGDVRKFSGLVKQGSQDVTAMGDAATKATDKMGLSAKELADYYSKVDDYFKGLTDNAFKFVNAEGAVFKGLQDLGQSIVDNGKSFSTMTESGRKNFDALSTVVSAFETDLQQRIDAGIITAKQGAKDLAAFAGGIYNELLRLGVKASDIKGILKTLGLTTSGFHGASAAVRQYAGVLTNAAAAARAAASANSDLGVAVAAAADYADRLNTALNGAYDQLHGIAEATDAVTTAEQALVDTHNQNLASVKSLTAANADLKSGIATDTTDIANYNKQIAIASRYGQKDKVADLTAKRNASQSDLTDKQGTLADNAKQIAELKKYGDSLKGNSKEAIANRAALLGLQKTMFDQIDAYAKTGASTKQVAAYTRQLELQFQAAGRQAGFSKGQLKAYTDNFATYARTVNAVPKVVKTTVTADTSPAEEALGSLPTTGHFTTTAVADTTRARAGLSAIPTIGRYTTTAVTVNTGAVANVLNHIPKKADYLITPRVSRATAQRALSAAGIGAGGGGSYAVRPSISQSNLNSVRNSFINALRAGNITLSGANVATLAAYGISVGQAGITSPRISTQLLTATHSPGYGNPTFMGGSMKGKHTGGSMMGFSGGGLVPGVPPINPHQDNLTVRGPSGKPVGLRSREYVIPEPAVDKYGLGFFNAIRNRTLPTSGPSQMAHYYGGGSLGGGGSSLGSGSNVVELSMTDRKMLAAIVNRPVVATIDGQRLDRVTANKQAAAARSGAN